MLFSGLLCSCRLCPQPLSPSACTFHHSRPATKFRHPCAFMHWIWPLQDSAQAMADDENVQGSQDLLLYPLKCCCEAICLPAATRTSSKCLAGCQIAPNHAGLQTYKPSAVYRLGGQRRGLLQ